jgi:hypothetical protein
MISRNLFAGVFASVFTLMVQPVDAATVYTYTGPNYLQFLDAPIPMGSYNASERLTGTFTVAGPLLNINGDITASVVNFSFLDGRGNTLDNLNASNFLTSFIVQTDPTGNILSWNITFANGTGIPAVVTGQFIQFATRSDPNLGDLASILECLSVSGSSCATFGRDQAVTFGPASDFVGTWSFTSDTAVTPLPAALPLFATGLGALSLLGWRRKRKTQAVA